MKIILTGATGFVGGEVLEQALDAASIDRVTVLTRRPLDVSHAKLEHVVLEDFTDYSRVADKFDADACIWCLGVSQTAVSRDAYVRITHDYTVAAARAMFARNPAMRFCFLSGSQADQQERSWVYYGKIKGRTERALSELSPNVVHFRPAMIRASRPSHRRPLIVRLVDPIAAVLDLFSDRFSVRCGQLAACLLDVAGGGADQSILDNRAIRRWNAAQPLLERSALPHA